MNLLDTEIVLLEVLMAANLIIVAVALIDLARRNLRSSDKLLWLLVIALIPLLGLLAYCLLIIKRKKGTTPL